MDEYKKFSIRGHAGQCLADISLEKLRAFLNWPEAARDWKLIRRVSSHGTYTYSFTDDLGEGRQEYFIKVFNKKERYQVAWKKMLSLKGLKKPWRYPQAMLRYLFSEMPVEVGFEKGRELMEQKIPTAAPVAYLCRQGRVFAWGLIITRKIPKISAEDLGEYLKQRKSELPAKAFRQEKLELIRELARLTSKLMNLNFFLPDLRISNILPERFSDGKFRLWVIDLVEAEDRKPPEEKMLYHLIADPRLAALFTGTNKIRFLKWYLSFSNDQRPWPEICGQVYPLLRAWWKKWHPGVRPSLYT